MLRENFRTQVAVVAHQDKIDVKVYCNILRGDELNRYSRENCNFQYLFTLIFIHAVSMVHILPTVDVHLGSKLLLPSSKTFVIIKNKKCHILGLSCHVMTRKKIRTRSQHN